MVVNAKNGPSLKAHYQEGNYLFSALTLDNACHPHESLLSRILPYDNTLTTTIIINTENTA